MILSAESFNIIIHSSLCKIEATLCGNYIKKEYVSIAQTRLVININPLIFEFST